MSNNEIPFVYSCHYCLPARYQPRDFISPKGCTIIVQGGFEGNMKDVFHYRIQPKDCENPHHDEFSP